MRGREFPDEGRLLLPHRQGLSGRTYEKMHAAYCAAFTRMGLNFRRCRPIPAPSAAPAPTNSRCWPRAVKDLIAFSDSSDYAANIEMAGRWHRQTKRPAATKALAKVATQPSTIDEVAAFLAVAPTSIAKTLLVLGEADEHGKRRRSSPGAAWRPRAERIRPRSSLALPIR